MCEQEAGPAALADNGYVRSAQAHVSTYIQGTPHTVHVRHGIKRPQPSDYLTQRLLLRVHAAEGDVLRHVGEEVRHARVGEHGYPDMRVLLRSRP